MLQRALQQLTLLQRDDQPGTDADGVTCHIPLDVLNQVRDVGFDELSMTAGQIPVVKNILRSSSRAEAQALLDDQQNLSRGDRERLYGWLDGGGRLLVPVSRTQLEALSAPLLERTLAALRRVLRDAQRQDAGTGLPVAAHDEVELAALLQLAQGILQGLL